VRPEYSYGVFFAAIAVAVAVVFERKRRTMREAMWALIPALIMLFAMFYVAKHSDSSRSGVAFAQHYNVRAAAKGLIPEQGSWDSDYAYRRFGIDPKANGRRHTIGEFFKANPTLFLKHVALNVLSPASLFVLLCWGAVIVAPFALRQKRGLREPSLYVALVVLPTVVSMLLVYPDAHYVEIIFPAVLLLAIQFRRQEGWLKIEQARWIPVAAGLLMVAGIMMATMSTKALADSKNPADYPLRLHIFGRSQTEFYYSRARSLDEIYAKIK